MHRNAARVPRAGALLSDASIHAMAAEARVEVAAWAAGARVGGSGGPATGGEAAAVASAEAAAAAATAAAAAATAAAASRVAAEHAALVAPAKRHTLRHAVVRDFFAAGTSRGPCPGARSSQGDAAAECYWSLTRELGGRGLCGFQTSMPRQRYSASGYRLSNHARL